MGSSWRAPVVATCAGSARARCRAGHPARGSLLRQGASGSLRRVARGRTVCLLGPHDVSPVARCPGGARAARPAASSTPQTPPVDGQCAQPGLDVGYHQAARTPQVGNLSPLRGAGSVLPLCRSLDGRRKGERHKRQAPDCQRLPKAGHSTRTTDAAPGPRRTDDGQDVFAVADGPRHPGQLQQTPRFR